MAGAHPHDPTDEPPLWQARLRWRVRGHLAAAAFVACLALETFLLAEVPFAGDGIDPIGAFLLGGFFNLAVVALVGPLGGMWLRRRRADLPAFVARDRASAAGMAVVALVLVVAGLAHRPALADLERDRQAQADAVRAYVRTQAPELAPAVAAADTVELGGDLFRTCVPSGEPGKALCLFVDTGQSPPGVTKDPDMRPNSVVSGPDNPGRRGG
jgi:hypothetical protein